MQRLVERLRDRILDEGPIPFRDLMAAALHDPDDGYYAKGPAIGGGGDFYTSANLRPFAWGLARAVADADRRLGEPDVLRVVEVGGGTGGLAANLRDDLAALTVGERVEMVLVEASPGLADAQARRGFSVVSRLADLPPAPTVLVANEVLDALPVHLVVGAADGSVHEMYVDVEGDRFVEHEGAPSTPELDRYFRDAGVTLPPGHRFEVNLAARDLLRDMARVVDPGYAFLVDYGERTEELVQPYRAEGTLVTYHEHRVGDDPYVRVGDQDITADVDWGAVERWAREVGFDVAGYVTQGRFLVALGLLDHMQEVQARDPTAALQVKNLLLPGSMGERFKVMGLAKGAPAEHAGFVTAW